MCGPQNSLLTVEVCTNLRHIKELGGDEGWVDDWVDMNFTTIIHVSVCVCYRQNGILVCWIIILAVSILSRFILINLCSLENFITFLDQNLFSECSFNINYTICV